jgi:hypothetical protein
VPAADKWLMSDVNWIFAETPDKATDKDTKEMLDKRDDAYKILHSLEKLSTISGGPASFQVLRADFQATVASLKD